MSFIDKNMKEYIDNIQPLCDGQLGELQKHAYEVNLPIIPNDVVRLMAVLLGIMKPKHILELGRIFINIYV